MAQVRTVDPDQAIDADIGHPATASSGQSTTSQSTTSSGELPASNGTQMPSPQASGSVYPSQPLDQSTDNGWNPNSPAQPPVQSPSQAPSQNPAYPQQGGPVAPPPGQPGSDQTYHEDDLIGAAEGVFGKGASGLADLIKDLLKKQGEPDAYIVGREAGAALAIGLRYGSGTLHHKIEGTQPVYWTGPSIGFDAGANASSAFVLVYNLYDTDDLYHRFAAGEGQAYLIGGFTVSYLRRGNVVLIPVRAGAGLRLGANMGYMKFSHKQNWLPF
nr:EipA family protein [Novosphingobium sp. 9]